MNPDFILLFNTKLIAIQIRNVIKITNNKGKMISLEYTELILLENKKIIGNMANKKGCMTRVLLRVIFKSYSHFMIYMILSESIICLDSIIVKCFLKADSKFSLE